MTYAEFVAELDRASLSIRAFAALVGMRPNSISNYASIGEVPGHLGLIAVLLSELKSHDLPFEAAIAKANPIRKRSRGRARLGRFGSNSQETLDLDHVQFEELSSAEIIAGRSHAPLQIASPSRTISTSTRENYGSQNGRGLGT